ncbi:HAD family hydrolase [Gracilimonas mengyeensis]|uniref:phosphoglycolate phosphatase n=1 Tax=Gracilimonas mengyeensis TaxID=1302730 RepID=A0A521E717_9BACT|nr:HAD family hydrolase [Gracilimonas mengyeensis]SMO78970.1 Phosphoglycolate phosphatase, HAD superfamily [Gracilimonas mengyeensis]
MQNQKPHPWVILFDIDGTLLKVNSKYNRGHLRRILDELDIDYPDMETDSFSGRTDHDIFTSFLVNHDYDEELYQEYKVRYLHYMQNVLLKEREQVTRHDDIDEALEFFFEGDFICGLLTGNYSQAADIKLEAADIDRDFTFGAFGEFEKDRNKLPQLAIDKVKELYDFTPEPSRFLIIGDTPRDVQCAKNAGMKCVAVTTGRYDRQELAEHGPDVIIDSLANPKEWFAEVTTS